MESEMHIVNTPDAPENVEAFTAECWYRTALLRLLIEDLEAVLSNSPQGNRTTIDAQMIRNCELPLRDLLDKPWPSPIEGLAKKNRSRLRVFDRRVGDGISNPAWLDLSLLKYTLEVWQRRLFEDQPSLGKRLSVELCSYGQGNNAKEISAAEADAWAKSPAEVFERWLPVIRNATDSPACSNMVNEQRSVSRLKSLIPNVK